MSGASTAATPARPRRREGWTATLVGVLVTLGALAVLFSGEDVGTADNGDGVRLMCPAGFGQVEGRQMATVEFQYRQLPAETVAQCQADSYRRYVTSASLLLRAWPAVDAVLSPEPGLDLRSLAVLYSVLFGLAFAALYLCLPGGRRFRLLGTLGAAVALLDVGLIAFFASPFSEPTGLIGFVLSIAALSAYLRAARPTWKHLLFVVLALGFTMTAKLQLLTLILLAVPLLLLRRVGGGRLTGPVRGRVLPASAAAVLLGVSGAAMGVQGQSYHDVNTYNVLFWAVLPSSPQPEAELERIGLPAEYVRYSGTHYWQPEGHGRFAPEWPAEAAPLSRATILWPVLTSPSRTTTLLERAFDGATAMRPPNLSNVEDRFEIVRTPAPTGLLLQLFGALPWFMLPLCWAGAAIAGLAVAVRTWRRRSVEDRWRDRQLRTGALLVTLLAVFAMSQVAVSVFGDGYSELEKHTTFAAACTGLLAGLGLGWFVAAVIRTPSRRGDQGRLATSSDTGLRTPV